jgi:hypothetical protein
MITRPFVCGRHMLANLIRPYKKTRTAKPT